MAYHAIYQPDTFRPQVGNDSTENPLEFDIVPAWGADLARVKSIVYSSMGLSQDQDWSPETQRAVGAAFEGGAVMFVNTVTAIRGLTVPAAMALRAGLIIELPFRVAPGQSEPQPDPQAPIPVTTGLQFSKLAGALVVIAFEVAMAIGKLSDRANLDPRFFGRPSGSGGRGPANQEATTTAGTAPRGRKNSGTAGRRSTPAADRPTDATAPDMPGTSPGKT